MEQPLQLLPAAGFKYALEQEERGRVKVGWRGESEWGWAKGTPSLWEEPEVSVGCLPDMWAGRHNGVGPRAAAWHIR
jgi:hypothetical protein